MRGYVLVLVAATLWSSIGVFYKLLITNYGLQPLAAATLRASIGGVLLLLVLVLLGAGLRVPRRDWPALLAYGTLGVAFFFVCYVNAVNLTGVAVAAVLMYTSPAWVAAISWRWMGEHLGRAGMAALLLALLGAALVARVYNPMLLRLESSGGVGGACCGSSLRAVQRLQQSAGAAESALGGAGLRPHDRGRDSAGAHTTSGVGARLVDPGIRRLAGRHGAHPNCAGESCVCRRCPRDPGQRGSHYRDL